MNLQLLHIADPNNVPQNSACCIFNVLQHEKVDGATASNTTLVDGRKGIVY